MVELVPYGLRKDRRNFSNSESSRRFFVFRSIPWSVFTADSGKGASGAPMVCACMAPRSR